MSQVAPSSCSHPKSPAAALRRFLAFVRNGGAASPPVPLARDRRVPPAMVGRGFRDPTHRDGVKRITITVEDATFEVIRAGALAAEVSLAEQARRLIERGLREGAQP